MSGRMTFARSSSKRIVPASPVIAAPKGRYYSQETVTTQCSLCQNYFESPVGTYRKYSKEKKKFLCHACRTEVVAGKNRERTNGICSKCGKSYRAAKNNYNYRTRNGLPCYCKSCLAEIVTEKRRAARQAQVAERIASGLNSHGVSMTDTWEAPCGHKIMNSSKVGARAKGSCFECNKRDDGMYLRCLDAAADMVWHGWVRV